MLYGFLYSLARFGCEFFREADSQMGYYALGLSMGQILSLVMIGVSVILALIVFLNPSYKAYPQTKHAKRKKR